MSDMSQPEQRAVFHRRKSSIFGTIVASSLMCLGPRCFAESVSPAVSYSHDIVPLFQRSCTGCHHPGKLKGELDLTTFSALQHGGKHGPIIVVSHPDQSRLVDEIS